MTCFCLGLCGLSAANCPCWAVTLHAEGFGAGGGLGSSSSFGEGLGAQVSWPGCDCALSQSPEAMPPPCVC